MYRFNKEEMRRYFERFDYIDYKYRHLLEGIDEGVYVDTIPVIRKELIRLERTKVHHIYDKIDYSQIHERLKLIYNDPDEAESFIFLYDFSLGCLIDRYLNIQSLYKLFSHHYFEYEWEQHVDMNFDKNELSFYRDHFMHQVRNSYMIMYYMDCPTYGGETYYSVVESTLRERTNSISQYACSQVEQYAEWLVAKISSDADSYVAHDMNRKTSGARLDEKYSSDNSSLFTGEEGWLDDMGHQFMEIADRLSENAESFAWNYLIRGSLIVAALFHDIGYPIRYLYKGIEDVSDYISLINPADNVGFDRLKDLLEDSLLFVTTDTDELRIRYNGLDHGALSAFILLLHFYETGTIHSLDPIKRAIIELAAVVIYDHTLRYRSIGDEKKTGDILRDKPSFIDNPLTYTLRFVDDIQEWDRLYFDIGETDSLRFCERCKMPVLSVPFDFQTEELIDSIETLGAQSDTEVITKELQRAGRNDAEKLVERLFSFDYDTAPALKRIDVCGCDNYAGVRTSAYHADLCETRKSIESKIFGHHFSPGDTESGSFFHCQKINYIITCDDVVLTTEGNKDIFYIDYNPYGQLHLLLLDHRSLSYRIKENRRLEKQFDRQSYINMSVKTHITDNPIMLKLRILVDFIYEAGLYINPDFSVVGETHSPGMYRHNMAYYGMFKDLMVWKNPGAFKEVSKFVHALKRVGFLAYDYEDEGLNWQKDDSVAAIDDTTVRGILRNAVNFLMWTESASEATLANTHTPSDRTDSTLTEGKFKDNLTNTAMCYMDILETHMAASYNGGRLIKFIHSPNVCHDSFQYVDGSHIDACKLLFYDCMAQLYFQSSTNGMGGYYDARAENSGKSHEMRDDDNAKKYVLSDDGMEYALDIVLSAKYYNPSIIRNEDVNRDSFTFFDIYSDMYLLKEMARFSADNKKRRIGASD